MNEKIRELMVNSGFATGYDRTQTGRWILSDKELEKFAELIVKETLQVARAGIEYGDGMEDAVYKYFGVKE